MLNKSMTTTMLPVADVERASRYYADKLGLHHRTTAGDGTAIFDAGNGDAIGLMKSEAGTQSKHTVLSFEVADITAEIRELEGRGVVFEDYDLPDLKTVNHIAAMGAEGVGPRQGAGIQHRRAAWFCDSEGNILCIHEVLAANT
jgi:predicted enzyme related to lactoylglutathione lyase